MVVLENICEKCNKVCNAIYLQNRFIHWTSGNDDIDKFIQDTQLSAHDDADEALEWIPYNRLHSIKYITKDNKYRANWIDVYGITQDPETKKYMVVLNDICEKCDEVCNSIHFQQDFKYWTSGNVDIDKFIQDIQLSVHNYYEVKNALEWIPYHRLHDVKYIAEDDKFGKNFK
uniref:Uncharacterized protein n=1 Tax=Rhizophagus irregularis (strain DAOM 181602 / DAOM 197198 / MUCL 43194) TaxID=747089 RepID=U9SQ37_RHIID